MLMFSEYRGDCFAALPGLQDGSKPRYLRCTVCMKKKKILNVSQVSKKQKHPTVLFLLIPGFNVIHLDDLKIVLPKNKK